MLKIIKTAIVLVVMLAGFSLSVNSAFAKESTVAPRAIEGPGGGSTYNFINQYSFSGGDLAWGTAAATFLLAKKFPKAQDKKEIATLIATFPAFTQMKFVVYTWQHDRTYETFNQVKVYDKNWNYYTTIDERPGY